MIGTTLAPVKQVGPAWHGCWWSPPRHRDEHGRGLGSRHRSAGASRHGQQRQRDRGCGRLSYSVCGRRRRLAGDGQQVGSRQERAAVAARHAHTAARRARNVGCTGCAIRREADVVCRSGSLLGADAREQHSASRVPASHLRYCDGPRADRARPARPAGTSPEATAAASERDKALNTSLSSAGSPEAACCMLVASVAEGEIATAMVTLHRPGAGRRVETRAGGTHRRVQIGAEGRKRLIPLRRQTAERSAGCRTLGASGVSK